MNRQTTTGRPAGQPANRGGATAVTIAACLAMLALGTTAGGQEDKVGTEAKPAAGKKAAGKKAAGKKAGGKKAGGMKASGEKEASGDEVKISRPLPDRFRPYRVLLSLAMQSDPLVSVESRDRLQEKIGLVLGRTVGETWSVELRHNEWLRPASVEGLDRLTAEAMFARYEAEAFDRVMLITVERSGNRFEVSGRPFNAALRTLALSRRRQEFDRRGLAVTVSRLALDMFRPTVKIFRGSPTKAEVTVRAGEFPTADPDSEQLQIGEYLEPFLRYRERKSQRVAKIQVLPWSYLKVVDKQRATVFCELATALRNPLRGGGRRVDLMAVGVASTRQSTRLRLLPRRNPSRPLIGHRVVVLPRRLTKKAASTAAPDEGSVQGKEEKKKQADLPPPRRLLSDRNGTVDVRVDERMPLVWLYVMSGNSVLARVPFVPGCQETLTLLLPDDSDRLGVEGEVARLQGELIETVARRAVLMAKSKKLAEAEKPDWAKVDQQFKEIEGLTPLAEFVAQLDKVEFAAIESAKSDRNKVAVSRIRRICSEAKELFQRHLSEDKLKKFREGLKATRTPAARKKAR